MTKAELIRRVSSGALPTDTVLTDLAREGERRGTYDQVLRDMVNYMVEWRQKQQFPAALGGHSTDEELLRRQQELQSGDIRRLPKIT